MAITGTFQADFSNFVAAVQKAEVSLKSFEEGSSKVETALTRMGNSLSGTRIVQQATLAAEAIERLGKEGGLSAGLLKLTDAELARVSATASEAAQKLTRMGMDVPPGIQKIADHAKGATDALARMSHSLSGTDIIQDATLMTQAVERVGGVSKLTEKELARVGATAQEAAAKMRAMGVDVPPGIQKIADATQKIGDAAQSSTKQTSSLDAAFGQLTAKFAAGAILANVVTGITRMGVEAIKAAADLNQLSQKTGLTVDVLQEMAHVATVTQSSLDAFTAASFQLSLRLAGGAGSVRQAASDLGLSFATLREQTKTEQWYAVAAALEVVTSASERDRLAVALLGRTWAEVQGGISAGFQGLAANTQKLSADTLATLGQLDDTWKRFKETMKGALAETAAQSTAPWIALLDVLGLLPPVIEKVATGTIGANEALVTYGDRAMDARAAVAALTDTQMAEIEAMRLLGATNEQIAATFSLSEDAVRLLAERLMEATTAQAQWKAEIAKSQGAIDAFNASVLSLTTAQEATIAAIGDRLFGHDAIAKATAYAEAIGSVANASGLAADAQAEVVQVMEAGIVALKAAGLGSEELAIKMREIQKAASEAGPAGKKAFDDIAVAANQAAVAANAAADAIFRARAAASAQAAADAVAASHAQGRAGVVPTGTSMRPEQTGGSFQASYTDAQGTTWDWDVFLKRYVPRFRAPQPRASGGPVSSGQSYLVGERGPEVFVPNAAGAIRPTVGGTVVHVTNYINGTAADVARQVSDKLIQTLKRGRQYGTAA